MATLWQFSKGHPKPAFSEKLQSGNQGKFFKNRPTSSARLKGPKRLWRKVNQNPPFLKRCKGGSKGNFWKIAQNVALAWKGQQHSGANCIILSLVCTLSAKTGEDFGSKGDTKSSRMAALLQFSEAHPKPAFSEKVHRGEEGKFFKNRQKSSPRLKGQTALGRKWHYPLSSMLL